MKIIHETRVSARCKVCKNKIFTWGVSGIETFFLKRKISLTFDDFVTCDKCADELRKVIKSSTDLKDLLRQAYLAGFNATGDGYNAEYPYDQKGQDPEEDTDWCEKRDDAIKSIMAEPPRPMAGGKSRMENLPGGANEQHPRRG